MSERKNTFAAEFAKKFAWLEMEGKTMLEIAEFASRFFAARELGVVSEIREIVEPRAGVMMQSELIERIQALADFEARSQWVLNSTKPKSEDPVLLLTGEGEYLVCRWSLKDSRWRYRGQALSELVSVLRWRYVDLGI